LHSQKIAKYQIKKAEEKQAKDTMARQAALEKMGIQVTQQEFGSTKGFTITPKSEPPLTMPPSK